MERLTCKRCNGYLELKGECLICSNCGATFSLSDDASSSDTQKYQNYSNVGANDTSANYQNNQNSPKDKKNKSWLIWIVLLTVVAITVGVVFGVVVSKRNSQNGTQNQPETTMVNDSDGQTMMEDNFKNETIVDFPSESSTPIPAEPGSEKHFVVATDMGFSPFEFQDAQGNIVGIDMDILAAIAEDQGFTYELQYIGWDAAIAACKVGQADGMIAGASITQERKDSGWIFSDGYYDATQGMAVAADSSITGFADLAGKKVAVKNGTMSRQYADSIKDQYGFEVVNFPTAPDMYQAVMDGYVDACIDDTSILRYIIKDNQLPMKYVEGTENEPDEYGMAIFDGSNQELIDLFNAGLKNIRANGIYDRILAKYLD